MRSFPVFVHSHIAGADAEYDEDGESLLTLDSLLLASSLLHCTNLSLFRLFVAISVLSDIPPVDPLQRLVERKINTEIEYHQTLIRILEASRAELALGAAPGTI